MSEETMVAVLVSVGVHPESAQFVSELAAAGDHETALNYLKSLDPVR